MGKRLKQRHEGGGVSSPLARVITDSHGFKPGHDGIVIIRSLFDIGPIKKGMNLCYGHAEKPRVRVGQVVNAGDWICNAGLANAWHFHFMVNHRPDARGVGDRDPRPILKYAKDHSS